MQAGSTVRDEATVRTTNGAALAAILAAGIGAFAIGFFVLVNEAGIFAAPAVYAPAGGVSGRTTFATAVWLITWLFLHRRWRFQNLNPRRLFSVTLVLIAVGILFTFPPVWWLL